MIVDVIIPALNEEKSISLVLREINHPSVRHVIVVNNGSTDTTAATAKAAGAVVLDEPQRGYGYACLKGMEWCNTQSPAADIIVFMDADHSDYPEEMEALLAPIRNNGADLVIGSRASGMSEKGSMTLPQRFGNWLATRMIHLIYGFRFTDLGPFRAIRRDALNALGMRDRTYGWTVEMQVRALKQKMQCAEVPVRYRKRIGTSKVSGTVKGTIFAGYKIITTILRHSLN
jgi:glycosyltransferase involved in cell wall biosynthesis